MGFFRTHSLLADFGLMSFVIVIAHLLRYRSKWLQIMYMPSSVVAGLLCLLLGPEFLDFLPFSRLDNGALSLETYPSWLVVFLFATLFMGYRKKKLNFSQVIEHSGDTFFFNLGSLFFQYGASLLFGLLILAPLFKSLPEGFGIYLPAGFIGGYGTAEAIGSVLEEAGWVGAKTIGRASATIGILTAIFGGMLLINHATRRGWTRMVSTMQKMPVSMRSGFVPEKDRQSFGSETVSPMALDPLSWHVALVLVVGMLAYLTKDGLNWLFSGKAPIPEFGLALLMGALLQTLLNRMNLGQYVDRHIIHRIGSLVTDFLIAFGIASIKTDIVMSFAGPLLIMCAFGFVVTVGYAWFIGRFICHNFWFERSITLYGWNTGSVATSVALLRIIDPDMRTKVLEDFGLSYIGISIAEISVVALVPALLINGFVTGPMVVLLLGFLACIVISKYLVGWFHYPPDAIRPGEAEVIAGVDEE